TKVTSAAGLVTKRRRHTHFKVDDLIDAHVAPEVIELYRVLIDEASTTRKKAAAPTAVQVTKAETGDLLPGAVSRLNKFIPERIVQIEQLYRELLAQTEARHKVEIEKISDHLAKTEAQHKAQVEELA